MSNRLDAGPLHLKAREILDIRDGEGLAVSCLRGVLWITQSDDTDDIVVREGESFLLNRPGLAIVSAPAGAADLIVMSPSDQAWERATLRSNTG